ncbi:MAG: acetate--CoA ligase family protein [Theionarchaea archaeon]|nr:acetate--CoA ligase family protein [Theionarchaea archaeon]
MHPLIRKALDENRSLMEHESKRLLIEYGLPVPPFCVCSSAEETCTATEQLGYPVVIKVVSPDILHKSDIGGVKLGLNSAAEVKKAFEDIKQAAQTHGSFRGVIVYPLQKEGTEIIIGAIYDDQFEHALMFGLGGIFVEILQDVSFRLIPLTEYDAREMIEEIQAFPVLTGVRGQSPRDIESIVDVMLKVSHMVRDHPQIRELDLNPIIVYEQGLSVIDARIVL